MSRRRKRAFDAATRSPMRLPRGHRTDVDYLNYQPDAAVDVTCPGRDGSQACRSRLIRYALDRDDPTGVTYSDSNRSMLVKVVPDSEAVSMTITCRCQRTSVIDLNVVRALLVGMLERDVKVARVSALRLASIIADGL